MSDFDSAVLKWLKGAKVHAKTKRHVLGLGMQSLDQYNRFDMAIGEGRDTVQHSVAVDWGLQGEMESELSRLQQSDEDADGVGAIFPSFPPILFQNVEYAGVAWLRDDGLLRLQIRREAIPVPLTGLPTKVPDLAKRGIVILEYRPAEPGYDELLQHVSPIARGESVLIPIFTDGWPVSSDRRMRSAMIRNATPVSQAVEEDFKASMASLATHESPKEMVTSPRSAAASSRAGVSAIFSPTKDLKGSSVSVYHMSGDMQLHPPVADTKEVRTRDTMKDAPPPPRGATQHFSPRARSPRRSPVHPPVMARDQANFGAISCLSIQRLSNSNLSIGMTSPLR